MSSLFDTSEHHQLLYAGKAYLGCWIVFLSLCSKRLCAECFDLQVVLSNLVDLCCGSVGAEA